MLQSGLSGQLLIEFLLAGTVNDFKPISTFMYNSDARILLCCINFCI